MEDTIKFPLKVAQELQRKLRLVKSAGQILEKQAQLEQEHEILLGMLELIKEGHIDPYDCIDKFEEFKRDPDRFQAVKEASIANLPSLGTVIDNPAEMPSLNGNNAEGLLLQNLKDLIRGY